MKNLWQFVLLFNCFPMFGQNCDYSINGEIYDNKGNLVPLAIISIDNDSVKYISSTSGAFVINHLCTGNHIITVNCQNYKTYEKQVVIKRSTHLDIVLEYDGVELREVNILSQKVTHLTQPVVELNSKELNESRGRSLGEILKILPGINAVQTGPSLYKPMIHGLYGNRILTVNNGLRLESQQWGSDHAPEIDPFTANKITVVKGASGVKYGSEAIGGVIILSPEEVLTTPGYKVGGFVSGFSNNNQANFGIKTDVSGKKIKGLGLRLSSSFKKGGNFKTPNYYLANTGSSEYNLSTALVYKYKNWLTEVYFSQFKANIGLFRGAQFGNMEDLATAITSSRPRVNADFTYDISKPYQEVKHQVYKLAQKIKIDNIGNLELIFGAQNNYRAEWDIKELGQQQDKATIDFGLTTYSANINFQHSIFKGFVGEVGTFAMRQANVVSSNNVRLFIPNYRSYNAGIFWTEKYATTKWEFEAGMRYDNRYYKVFKYDKNELISPELRYDNFSYSLGANRLINKHITLKSNIGTAYRPPGMNELYADGLHHGLSSFEIGNQNLKTEVAYNTNLSLVALYSKTKLELTVFNNVINNYIYLTPSIPAVVTVRGVFLSYKYVQADIVMRGVDLYFEQLFTKTIKYQLKASGLIGKNRLNHDYLIMMPPNRVNNTIDYIFGKKGIFHDLTFSLNHQYVAKQNNLPTTKQTLEINTSSNTVTFGQNDDYLAPPSGYHLFGSSLSSNVKIRNQIIDFRIGVQNVFNITYRDYLNRYRYFANEAGRNFFFQFNFNL